jgi:hypothetical protein
MKTTDYNSGLTVERLKSLLKYDPQTGFFAWLADRGRKPTAGKIAGHRQPKSWVIRVDGRLYGANRLAWLFMHGTWPAQVIDHINGNPHDNRIENLRDVSHTVNLQNQRKANCDSQTGLLGVSPFQDRFAAHIKVNGRVKYLGLFSTAEAGHEAYLTAKRKLHEGCTI